MSRLSECLYGDLTEIANYLDSTEDNVDIGLVKAILSNLCRHVAAIEKLQAAVTKRHAEIDKALAETVGG